MHDQEQKSISGQADSIQTSMLGATLMLEHPLAFCRSGNLKASTAIGAAKAAAGLLGEVKERVMLPALRAESAPRSLDEAYAMATVSGPIRSIILTGHALQGQPCRPLLPPVHGGCTES